MKYVVIIGDGMADKKLKELGGLSPLQKAFTPNMDKLAREGTPGMTWTIPKGMPPGSDIANLSILGYDPASYYTGRAPLEAASMGVPLGNDDVAYRCNLVSLRFDRKTDKAFMDDHSGGHISSQEASALIDDLNKNLATEDLLFYPGVSYRCLMVHSGGKTTPECTPPHDILGREITDYLPAGDGADVIQDLMLRSVDLLEHHAINKAREGEGKRPANSIWLWGQGRKPSIPSFSEKFGLKCAMVSAVDLTKGLGVCAGFEILKVPGVTGYLNTNYAGKAEYSLKALETMDLAYIHVEAPDEAGHSGNVQDKIKAIEDFDALVVGTVLRGLKSFDSYRVLLMPDHATPIELRTHTDEPVPFVIYESGKKKNNPAAAFDEDLLLRPDILRVERGHDLMELFLKGNPCS